MDSSRSKLLKIIAVIGLGLAACGIKLWLDSAERPSVIYRDNENTVAADTGIDDSVSASVSSEERTNWTEASSALPDEITPSVSDEIPVYLCGAVRSPGIYRTGRGAYLYEVIDMAGGLLPEAAAEYINLVFELTDAVSIYIPTVEEMQSFLDGQQTASSDYLRNGLLTGIWGTGQPGQAGTTVAGESGAAAALININTADQATLETLPGIGAATAKAIIAYREKTGGFNSIEDIMNVAGIKEGRYEAIRDLIVV
jgi:competence protein ComEA